MLKERQVNQSKVSGPIGLEALENDSDRITAFEVVVDCRIIHKDVLRPGFA